MGPWVRKELLRDLTRLNRRKSKECIEKKIELKGNDLVRAEMLVRINSG